MRRPYLVIRQARFERVNKSRVQKRNPDYEKQKSGVQKRNPTYNRLITSKDQRDKGVKQEQCFDLVNGAAGQL
jgi:sigma54-dependent transcription regulator